MNETYRPPVDPLNPPYVITKPSYPPGGNGKNQGRKEIADPRKKKKQVPIGIRLCDIDLLGGDDKVKMIMLQAIREALGGKLQEVNKALGNKLSQG
jgi:hypothetical protein